MIAARPRVAGFQAWNGWRRGRWAGSSPSLDRRFAALTNGWGFVAVGSPSSGPRSCGCRRSAATSPTGTARRAPSTAAPSRSSAAASPLPLPLHSRPMANSTGSSTVCCGWSATSPPRAQQCDDGQPAPQARRDRAGHRRQAVQRARLRCVPAPGQSDTPVTTRGCPRSPTSTPRRPRPGRDRLDYLRGGSRAGQGPTGSPDRARRRMAARPQVTSQDHDRDAAGRPAPAATGWTSAPAVGPAGPAQRGAREPDRADRPRRRAPHRRHPRPARVRRRRRRGPASLRSLSRAHARSAVPESKRSAPGERPRF